MSESLVDHRPPPSIWWFAFGYFACYVPYSALTKAVTSGAYPGMVENLWEGMPKGLPGAAILPVSVMSSVVGMFTFITVMRWWKYAAHRDVMGVSLATPTKFTIMSGICVAGIILTTTMAYTFTGVSIVFMMLLMRGGVLIIAPVVDALTGRKTRWFSWVGLAFSMAALVVAFLEKGGTELHTIAVIDITLYLACYFVRLQFMSKKAKSKDRAENIRYFVEEQMVASPVALLILVVVAFGFGVPIVEGVDPAFADNVLAGFTMFWGSDLLIPIIVLGLFSQGTGIFGGLVLLHPSENTYSVPVNRSSSIMAGVVAAFSLWYFLDMKFPSGYKLAGAGLIIVAILFLSIPNLLKTKTEKTAKTTD